MIQKVNHPVLIVGQGIAGTVLALRLQEAGVSFEIMDDGHKSSSSIVAAGLFNPWILKRRKLAWAADEFLTDALPFYRDLDSAIAQDVFHPIGIWRRIHDAGEFNDWQALKSQEPHRHYLGGIEATSNLHSSIDAGLGWQEIRNAGYVDVSAFLGQTRTYFQEAGNLRQERFEEKEVEVGKELSYRGETYAQIVICTGHVLRHAHYLFPDLPFNPAKGHTLDVHIPGLDLKQIVQGACFIIPLGDDLYRVGSTYSWNQLDEQIEEEEVEKLESSLKSFCSAKYEIRRSYAGVRPATRDSKPFLGMSEIDQRIMVFGGFGSRAIMTAPLLANHMLGLIKNRTPVPPEVDIKRLVR